MRLQVLVDLADRISGPANNIVRTLGGLERAAVQTSSAIDRIQMGASLAAAALALAAPIGLATRAAIEFESAFADVKKVVEFTPALGPEVLQQQLIALSRQIPRSAAELTQIAAAAGQAGIALEELASFTEDAAKVAVAFDISAQEAGDTLAKLRNIFGMTQPQVVQLADAVNHLSNNMAATAPQILEVLKRIGGTGQLVGLTAQQMAALGAAMLATGTRPEVVATGLQALINRLANATTGSKQLKMGLEAIGYSAEGMEAAIRKNAQGAILDFLRTVNNSKDPLKVLSLIFGQEYADDIARLAKALPLVEQGYRLVGDSQAYAGSVGQEFASRSATTANQLQLLRNDLQAIAITLGQVFLPPVQRVVGAVRGFLDQVMGAIHAMPGLSSALGGLTAGLGGVVLAAGGGIAALAGVGMVAGQARMGLLLLREGMSALALRAFDLAGALDRAILRLRALGGPIPAARAAVLGLAGAFRALTAAMLANPVGALLAGLLALGAAFVWAWQHVQQFRDQVRLALVPLVRAWNDFRFAIAGLALQFGPVGEVIAAALGRAYGALDALGYAFGFVLGFIMTLAINVFARIGASIVSALTGLVNLVRGLLEALVGLFTGNFERARAGVEQIMQGLVQVITAPLALLGQQAVEWGRNIMGGLAQGLSAGLSGVAERIAQGGEAIKNWFRSLFQIRSPSRVFAGYGLMLSLGLAQGIEAGMPQVAEAVAGMEQSLQPRVELVQPDFSRVAQSLQPQVELAQPGLTPPPAQARPRTERSITVSINIEQIQIGSGQPRQVVQELQPAIKEAVLLALEELALEEGVDG